MNSTTAFGSWLRQRRRSFDLTQHELAARIGGSVASMRKFESGERRPSRQMVELLAEHIGIAGDERETFIRFARTDKGAANFRHPLFNETARLPQIESYLSIEDIQTLDPETMRWIALHDDCPPLSLGKRPIVCSISNGMAAPGRTQNLGEGRIMCQLQTIGQVMGDLNGILRQDITEMAQQTENLADRLSSLNSFFSIETADGVIRGYCSGSFYEKGVTAHIQQHGRILSVTRAYADVYDADIFYRSEVPLVTTSNGKEGFRDRGTLTITPH